MGLLENLFGKKNKKRKCPACGLSNATFKEWAPHNYDVKCPSCGFQGSYCDALMDYEL